MGFVSRPKSLRAVVDHRVRRLGLQAARLAGWWASPGSWPAPRRYDEARDGRLDVLAQEVHLPLASRDGPDDAALEAGKHTNLRLAIAAFDGLVVAPDRPLSFWRA